MLEQYEQQTASKSATERQAASRLRTPVTNEKWQNSFKRFYDQRESTKAE